VDCLDKRLLQNFFLVDFLVPCSNKHGTRNGNYIGGFGLPNIVNTIIICNIVINISFFVFLFFISSLLFNRYFFSLFRSLFRFDISFSNISFSDAFVPDISSSDISFFNVRTSSEVSLLTSEGVFWNLERLSTKLEPLLVCDVAPSSFLSLLEFV